MGIEGGDEAIDVVEVDESVAVGICGAGADVEERGFGEGLAAIVGDLDVVVADVGEAGAGDGERVGARAGDAVGVGER